MMEEQSVREILEEAFNKILENHKLAVRDVEFIYSESLNEDVKLIATTVNAKAIR